MDDIKIYKKNNRTILEYYDEDRGVDELISKMGTFDIEINEEDERVDIVDMVKPSFVISRKYANILDEDGVSIGTTFQEFNDYFSIHTGFNSASGGSDATGWAQYGDSKYTVGSPLTITVGNTEIIDIDGLGTTIKSQIPFGVSDLYDTASSKITPISSGDGYSFSLGFKGANTSNNGDASIFVDIGGGFTRLFARTFRFPRGQNTFHDFFFTSSYYSLDTFIANGGLIKIESGTGTTSIYDITLQIHRTHKAK